MKRIVLLSMLCMLAASAVGQVSYAKDLDSATHSRMVEEVLSHYTSTGFAYFPATICDSTGCVDVVLAGRGAIFVLFELWGIEDTGEQNRNWKQAQQELERIISQNDTIWASVPQQITNKPFSSIYCTYQPSAALIEASTDKESLLKWAYGSRKTMDLKVNHSDDFAAVVRLFYMYGMSIWNDCMGGGTYYMDHTQHE